MLVYVYCTPECCLIVRREAAAWECSVILSLLMIAHHRRILRLARISVALAKFFAGFSARRGSHSRLVVTSKGYTSLGSYRTSRKIRDRKALTSTGEWAAGRETERNVISRIVIRDIVSNIEHKFEITNSSDRVRGCRVERRRAKRDIKIRAQRLSSAGPSRTSN